MTKNPNLMFQATLAHFEAKRAEALATLQVYFSNSVAISEHSAHVQECVEWTKKLSEAEESITILKSLAAGDQPPQE